MSPADGTRGWGVYRDRELLRSAVERGPRAVLPLYVVLAAVLAAVMAGFDVLAGESPFPPVPAFLLRAGSYALVALLWAALEWRALRRALALHEREGGVVPDAAWRRWWTRDQGMLGFGLTLAALFVLEDTLFEPAVHRMVGDSAALGLHVLLALVVNIPIWLAAGFLWGLLMWKWVSRRDGST